MRVKPASDETDYAPLEMAQEAVAKGREAAQLAAAKGLNASQEAFVDGRDAVQRRFEGATKWASSETQRRPLRALGIAAAVGAMIGLLIARH